MAWRKGNRLRLVSEAEAQGRTLEIYGEIKHAMGVPHVNVVYQAFAAYPVFLDLHWRSFRPVLETQEFFNLSDRLRADAYTRTHNYFAIPDLWSLLADVSFSEGAHEELAEVIDLFHYQNPLLLLLLAAQVQAFEGPVGESKPAVSPALISGFEYKPILIEDASATPRVRQVLDEIRRILRLPFLNTDYRALARWPDILAAYWQALKQVVQSPLYESSHYGVRETAYALARELPGPIELTTNQLSEAGMDDTDISSVVRMTELFVQSISGLLLNIAFAKIGFEGGNRKPAQAEKGEGGLPRQVA